MNNQAAKPAIDKSGITMRLYTIQNIANLAAEYPESKAEAHILQDIAGHIAGMINELIEDIGA